MISSPTLVDVIRAVTRRSSVCCQRQLTDLESTSLSIWNSLRNGERPLHDAVADCCRIPNREVRDGQLATGRVWELNLVSVCTDTSSSRP